MVYVFLADGFEEIEALTIVDVLRRADIRTQMVSVNDKIVTGAHGIAVRSDILIHEIHMLTDISMLVLPGGMPGTKHLAESNELKNLLKEAYDTEIYLAAICAAPTVLAQHNLIKGRKITCYPGYEKEMRDMDYVHQPVVQDGKLITANGPGSAMPFALRLVEILKGHKVSEHLGMSMQYLTTQ